MQVQPLVPLRSTVMLPLASMSATVAWAVIEAGPAESARATFWSLVSVAAEAAATVVASAAATSATERKRKGASSEEAVVRPGRASVRHPTPEPLAGALTSRGPDADGCGDGRHLVRPDRRHAGKRDGRRLHGARRHCKQHRERQHAQLPAGRRVLQGCAGGD